MLPAYSTWPQDPSPQLLAGRVKAGPSAGETDEYQRVPSAGTTDEDDQSRVRSPALSSGMLSLQQAITIFGDSKKWVQIPGWLLQIKNLKFLGCHGYLELKQMINLIFSKVASILVFQSNW